MLGVYGILLVSFALVEEHDRVDLELRGDLEVGGDAGALLCRFGLPLLGSYAALMPFIVFAFSPPAEEQARISETVRLGIMAPTRLFLRRPYPVVELDQVRLEVEAVARALQLLERRLNVALLGAIERVFLPGHGHLVAVEVPDGLGNILLVAGHRDAPHS